MVNTFVKSKYHMSVCFIMVGIFILLSLPLCLSETETYQVNKLTDLKFTCTLNNAIPSASAKYNITISYPNGTTFIPQDETSSLGNGAFNYTTNFTEIGLYKVQMFCWDNSFSFSNEGYYYITGNGKADPSGNVVVFFSIIFIITVILVGFITLYSIGHLMALDFDILDLAIDWGIYFGIIALFFLQNFYLGNNSMGDWLLLLIKIGGVILVLVPLIALVLSITVGTLKNKGIQNVPQPRRFSRWRR